LVVVTKSQELPAAADLPKFHHQVLTEPPVERPERLIEHQQAGFWGERARKGNPLALPTGKTLQRPRPKAAQPNQLEQLVLAVLAPLPVPAHAAQTKTDVPLDVHMREQGVVLEHEPESTPMRWHAQDVQPIEEHLARFGPFEPRDDPQQRRLAAPAWSQQRDGLARGHAQVHPTEDVGLPCPKLDVTHLEPVNHGPARVPAFPPAQNPPYSR